MKSTKDDLPTIRFLLLRGFGILVGVSLALILLIVLLSVNLTGKETEDIARDGLDSQVRRHLQDAASELSAKVDMEFSNIENRCVCLDCFGLSPRASSPAIRGHGGRRFVTCSAIRYMANHMRHALNGAFLDANSCMLPLLVRFLLAKAPCHGFMGCRLGFPIGPY